jgi:hypothetical protein
MTKAIGRFLRWFAGLFYDVWVQRSGRCWHCDAPVGPGERFCNDEHEAAYAGDHAWG